MEACSESLLQTQHHSHFPNLTCLELWFPAACVKGKLLTCVPCVHRGECNSESHCPVTGWDWALTHMFTIFWAPLSRLVIFKSTLDPWQHLHRGLRIPFKHYFPNYLSVKASTNYLRKSTEAVRSDWEENFPKVSGVHRISQGGVQKAHISSVKSRSQMTDWSESGPTPNT